jgi:hypothetical protein
MKNSLACVIFKMRQLEKWENYKKISYQKALVVLYRVESKLVLISKYNKTIDKVFREKKIK